MAIYPELTDLQRSHKPNYPFRNIISAVDSTLYNLATFVHGLIIDNISKASSHMNNSYNKKLNNIQIKLNFNLVSLNVISYLQISLWT